MVMSLLRDGYVRSPELREGKLQVSWDGSLKLVGLLTNG